MEMLADEPMWIDELIYPQSPIIFGRLTGPAGLLRSYVLDKISQIFLPWIIVRYSLQHIGASFVSTTTLVQMWREEQWFTREV